MMKGAYLFCLTVLLTFCAHGQICPVRPVSAPRDINPTIAETERYLHCLQNKTNTPGLAMESSGAHNIFVRVGRKEANPNLAITTMNVQ